MNPAKLLEKRRDQWSELENLCDAMESKGRTDKAGGAHHQGAEGIARFSTLYRSACADLALADAYQLPPGTVTYLHRLVARSHNQLYRANKFEPNRWTDVLFREAPQQIFADACVRWAAVIFFGLFAMSLFLGRNETMFPEFAQRMVGTQQLEQMEEMYEQPLNGSLDHYVQMSGFYIQHNTGIGLSCFASGVLIIPCLFNLAYNAVVLGTVFGFMARPDVTGGVFSTGGLTRIESLRESAMKAVPVMAASAMLFIAAAFTEGFLSPSPAPYVIKAMWAVLSSGLISFYFVVLGFPRNETLLKRIEPAGEFSDAT